MSATILGSFHLQSPRSKIAEGKDSFIIPSSKVPKINKSVSSDVYGLSLGIQHHAKQIIAIEQLVCQPSSGREGDFH